MPCSFHTLQLNTPSFSGMHKGGRSTLTFDGKSRGNLPFRDLGKSNWVTGIVLLKSLWKKEQFANPECYSLT